MSLILEALRKSEREREGSPGTRSPLAVPRRRPMPLPERRGLGIGIAAVLLLAVAALAWLLQHEDPQAPDVSAAPPEPPAAERPETAVPAAPLPAPGLRPAEPKMPPASAAAPAPQPASAPVEEPQVVDLSAQLGRPDPAPAASPSRPVDPPSSDVPLLLEMPPEFQLSVPAPDIQVHFYAREPGRRFVLIGGRRFQGGEEIAPGLILDEIVRDGLLVEWRGERFVMPARR